MGQQYKEEGKLSTCFPTVREFIFYFYADGNDQV